MAHNALLNFDRLGWTYMGLFIVWNVALIAAVSFLWAHRQLPSIRMRRLPLLLAGIIPLHLFGSLCLIAYTVGAVAFPCTFLFFYMSLVLPTGIALFHASNSQFLHMASRQKQFAHMSTLKDHKPINEEKAQAIANSRWRRVLAGVERADKINRTLLFIGIGLFVQLILTFFVYFGSKKFHPGYGIFDYTVHGTASEINAKCAKGWEWWLSIVWQLFWAWVYAPYILWKSRSIRDVHGWRLQTICCCLAGLPATPLWFTGMYIPQMGPLDAVLPPAVWFSICIFFMEVFTIGFPIADIIKGNSLRKETLDAIKDWERCQALNAGDGSMTGDMSFKSPSKFSDSTTLKSSGGNVTIDSKDSFESNKSDMLTMTALENALRTNATPLLQFAALKDFSGENVSFLTHVADWRRHWFAPKVSTTEHHRKQFIAAVRIYTHFVSLEFSEFPINISSREMKLLHNIFESAAVLLHRSIRGSISSSNSDNATPFDNVLPDDMPEQPFDCKSSYKSTTELTMAVNLDSLGRANLRSVSRMQPLYMEDVLADVDIPASFNEMVFDSAESEIKYLVLTNTWSKFVNVSRANSQMSKEVDEENGIVWMKKILCSS